MRVDHLATVKSMKGKLIFSFMGLYSILLLLPIVSTDYPFTSRPFTRTTDESNGHSRKSSEANKKIKTPYQGYLAFMLICEPDTTCISVETKLEIIRCLENGLSLAAIYLYKQCTGQGTITCEDATMVNTIKNCLKAQSGSFANLITDASRQCIREKVTLGNIDCYKINNKLRMAGQRFSINPLTMASHILNPSLVLNAVQNPSKVIASGMTRPISIFDHLTSTVSTVPPTTTATTTPSTTTMTTVSTSLTTPSTVTITENPSTQFMSYFTPSFINNMPFKPNDYISNRFPDFLNNPNLENRFPNFNSFMNPHGNQGNSHSNNNFNQRPYSNHNQNGNFFNSNPGNSGHMGGSGFNNHNPNNNNGLRRTTYADVVYEEYYVDDEEDQNNGNGNANVNVNANTNANAHGHGHGDNIGPNLPPANVEANNRNGQGNRRIKQHHNNQNFSPPNGSMRNRKTRRQTNINPTRARNRGQFDGPMVNRKPPRPNRQGSTLAKDYEEDFDYGKASEVVSK